MLGVSLNIFTLAIRRYFGGGGGQFAGSSLNLDMTSGNRTLDPRITFSRASNATVTGPNGTLQYAPHNLLTFSEQFDNALWAKNVATVTANLAVAPDGTTTADLLTSTGADGYAGRNTLGLGGGLQYTASVYLRADAPTTLRLYLLETAGGSAVQSVICNVTTEWQRFSVSLTTGAAVTAVSMQVGGGSSFGTGKTAYLWGAQLNVGSLQPYYTTTVKNQLGFTQEFDNAAWTKSNSLIQTNQIRNNTAQGAVAGSPGTLPTNWSTFTALTGLTRQVVGTGIEDGISYLDVRISGTPSASGSVSFYTETSTAVAALPGQTWTTSAYFKLQAGSLTGITSTRLYFQENNSGGSYLTEQNIGVTAPTGASLTSQRATASRTLVNASTAFLMPGFNLLLTGAAIDITLRIGMPQLVQGATAGDVVATYGTARAVMYPAPDGSLTADKLVENTANSQHICQQLFVPTAGGRYTLSHNVKAAERSFAVIGFSGGGLGADCVLGVNLTTGAVVSTAGAPESTSVVSLGSGWYRVSVTKTLPTATNCNCRVLPSTDGINQVYTGDGTSGIYIWGAQLSDSASLDPYVYNPGAAPTSQAYYGPRFDYDFVTLAARGLLIEEQRTNLVLQSEAFESASWPLGGGTITSNAALSPDGTTDADEFTELLTTAQHNIHQIVSVVSGLAYTYSVFVKNTNIGFVQVMFPSLQFGATAFANFNIATGSLGTVGATATATVSPAANGFYRISVTATATATGSASCYINGITSATAARFESYLGTGKKFLLYGAQLEAGAFPTSYIPTTTAAATRAADVATMTGANFSNWYRQDEGSVFVEASGIASVIGATRRFVEVNDNSANNRLIVGYAATNSTRYLVQVAGVSQADVTVAATAGSVVKMADVYKLNDFQQATNSALGSADTLGTVPVVSQVNLGAALGDTGSQNTVLNGHLRRIAFFQRRLSAAELTGITA